MTDQDLTREACRVVDLGKEKGIALRVMGATAFRIHCPKYADLHSKLGRELSDLDFAAIGKQKEDVFGVIREAGYQMDRKLEFVMKMYDRFKFQSVNNGWILDVFFDKLEMCHTIDFAKRLQLDYPTLNLSDLLLEKLQIVQLTDKDVKDSSILLLEHEVGQGEPESIDCDYIARLFADDWGFYYTGTTNLRKVHEALTAIPQLKESDKSTISNRIDRLLTAVEERSKSMGWKMRAKIGPSKKWYRDVDGTPA